jgi:hypothetical protein
LSSANASCKARTAAFVSEFFTMKARLSSDEPCVIMDMLILFFSIAPKTTNNWWFHTPTNREPYNFNVAKGDKIPNIIQTIGN